MTNDTFTGMMGYYDHAGQAYHQSRLSKFLKNIMQLFGVPNPKKGQSWQ
jgi:hypothetical protein